MASRSLPAIFSFFIVNNLYRKQSVVGCVYTIIPFHCNVHVIMMKMNIQFIYYLRQLNIVQTEITFIPAELTSHCIYLYDIGAKS